MPNATPPAATLSPAILETLNRAFTYRYHSLARYLLDAHPYVREADRPTLDVVRRLAEWDYRQAERLADLIEGFEGIPQVTPYEHEVPEMNYLALAYLRAILAGKLAHEARDLERAATTVGECPPARDLLAKQARDLRKWIDLLR